MPGRQEPDRLRVLIVARQPIVRAGLRALLAERNDLLVVGQALSAGDVERAALELAPEVVLAAWQAGDADEVVALAATVDATRTPAVLTGEAPSAGELSAVLAAGVRGFLLSEATADELAAALHAVRLGLLVLDPLVGRMLAPTAPALDLAAEEPLTEREREVLQLLAQGLPNKTIATRLHISEHTVKFHVGSIMAKLNAASRTEAVTRAARRGLLAL